ncbi:MAG: T9SS-dependent M36 family metallopeptidase [Bacteroidota bacterium]
MSTIVGICFLLLFGTAYSQDYKSIATNYLSTHYQELDLTPGDWDDLMLQRAFTDDYSGATHIYLQQKYNEIRVHEAILNVTLGKTGEVVYVSHSMVPKLSASIKVESPELTPTQALQAAATHLDLPLVEEPVIQKVVGGPEEMVLFGPSGISTEAIQVGLTYQSVERGNVALSWNVRIRSNQTADWWNVRIDAKDGEVLSQNNWTTHCAWGEKFERREPIKPSLFPSFEPKSTLVDGSSYRVFPLTVESPNHGAQAIVQNPADVLASPFGWHDVDGVEGAEFTITRGNNAWAQGDRNGDDGIGASPDGGPSLDFTEEYDLTQVPSSYLNGSIINIFYWNNICHDIFYRYGFDENSGNFQQNNYGRGGEEGDFVFADSQDGSGFNNANFQSPPDGENGRMQMFLWTSGSSDRPLLTVNSPASIAGSYNGAEASFGPGLGSEPLSGTLELVEDSAGTSQACSPILNAGDLEGKIALLQRGECFFVEKVIAAQDAGAIAVVVGNNQAGPPFPMGGTDPNITIPSIMISLEDYNLLVTNINSNIEVSMGAVESSDDLDSGFDNGIIAHEYGHGVSIRLTGGPDNSCLSNLEQMGEGWSDWLGMVLTVRDGDDRNTARGIGTFALGEATNGPGIRPAPYTTDMSVNGLTYADISGLSIPHGVGSVFATMMWDMYWDLVDTYGYDEDLYEGTGGNNIAIQLVLEGMKLQPCTPGFVDGRDAILAADRILYDGANQCLIWEAFARRGLGFSASQGSVSSVSDGEEAFDLPPLCATTLQLQIGVPEIAQNGSQIEYNLKVINSTEGVLTDLVVSDTLDQKVNLISGSSSCNIQQDGQILSWAIEEMQSGDTLSCSFQLLVDADATTEVLFIDDFEDNLFPWSANPQVGEDFWVQTEADSIGEGTFWFAVNAPRENDQPLEGPGIVLGENPELRFEHAFFTEAGWDGGLVELQIAGQQQWRDLGEFMIENGYNSGVGTNNPAGSRAAFSGDSEGLITTKVDLSAYANQTVQIRFRMVSDNNTNELGWYVGNVEVIEKVSILRRTQVIAAEGDEATEDAETEVRGTVVTSISPQSLKGKISLFPNPGSDMLVIDWKELPANSVNLTLMDLRGRTILQVENSPSKRAELDTSDLPQGVYLLEWDNGTNRETFKWIKQ